jgi:hypothetical protein
MATLPLPPKVTSRTRCPLPIYLAILTEQVRNQKRHIKYYIEIDQALTMMS